MRSVNKVILIGNVTWKDDLTRTEGNTAVCTFGMATNRDYTDAAGTKHEETDFHRIVAFGKLAELCDQFIRKGRKIYAEGRLHSHTWTDNEGKPKHATEIILSDMTLLDKKPEEVAEVPAEPVASLNREQRGTTQL